ncbi:MAG: hypothetical protein GWN61_24435, partial [candidate division Zixibacteria bacterium]|nr:hypothetical protein [candidate division Zixibacteria bacterium]NIW50124.1 hypothetical protein [Gammaproteobacteria bacterium]NIR67776.1 hypothetical protein [candidate division Zixibacteria bacterium]NIS49010.1 hypothetical protein [candidate division Zixibacteria bacterium]NIU17094.1 hypothetical protein [candidate division Zixibacteria bacterium]
GNPTNITNNPAADFEPSIDPTGEWVAFASERSGNLEIFVTRITGEELYNLTQN